MEITEIAPLDNKRRRVYIDGEYAFPLYLSELRKYNIEAGNIISDESYNDICIILTKRVRERILYLIGNMDRTEHDIRQKLRNSGYFGSIVDNAIAGLKEYGYIDDTRYARYYAQSMRDNKGKSTFAITQALYEKGIDRNIISNVMDEMEIDEEEQLMRALSKKGYTPETIHMADDADKRKIYQYLLRKGFSASLVGTYVRKSC